MSRFVPYLGIVVALIFVTFVVTFSSDVVQNVSPTKASSSPPTLVVLPGFTLPLLTFPTFVPETSTATSSSTKQTVPIKKATVSTPTATSVPPVSITAPATHTTVRSASLNTSASALINALVNIICLVPAGSGLHSISGSGVVIDPKGIILTNAHVAQYFLLTDRTVRCRIRTGSPAGNSYEASLIYISPLWLRANTTVLTEANPIGTGEYDFALLAVTKSTTSVALSSFSFLPLAVTPPDVGTPIVTASYGAQFLETSQIQSSLFPILVFGVVKDVFTFATNTIDVLALGGSAIAQEGSSGGGVASERGELVGTITTSTVEGDINTRSLNAITTSYIRAEYASETGSALDLLLARPIESSINDFVSKMPALESIITAQLP